MVRTLEIATYGDEIRTLLRPFGTDQTTVDKAETIEYLRSRTEEIDLVGEIEQWRDGHITYGLDELTGDSSTPNDYPQSGR